MINNEQTPFDFAEHEKAAVAVYLKIRPFYADLAAAVARVIQECVKKRRIKVHSVENRPKGRSQLRAKGGQAVRVRSDTPKVRDTSETDH